MAWRLSTELVVAVAVGGGLGYGADQLVGSTPWLMLVGLGFGFAAGVRGVMRAAQQMQSALAPQAQGADQEMVAARSAEELSVKAAPGDATSEEDR